MKYRLERQDLPLRYCPASWATSGSCRSNKRRDSPFRITMIAGIMMMKVKYAVLRACKDVSFGFGDAKLWLHSVSSAACGMGTIRNCSVYYASGQLTHKP